MAETQPNLNNHEAKLPATYASMCEQAANARQTAENMRSLAQQYEDAAKRWDERADGFDATAAQIATRHMGQGAIELR